MWCYLLKNKSDAFDVFKKFRALVEKDPKKKVTTFRTDRGGEFVSKEFLEYCEEADIARQFTTPYSPQQNGVVERRNITMIEIYDVTEPVEMLDEELMIMGIDEPVNFNQDAKESEWRRAMKFEMEAVEKNNTWKLTTLPPGRKAIGLKWIYKIKRDANGEIIKHKARIVAKGYVQKQGVDFEDVFAPVTRIETIRLLLALAAKNCWEVHHLDVKTAFLNGEIQEEVYVTQP